MEVLTLEMATEMPIIVDKERSLTKRSGVLDPKATKTLNSKKKVRVL
jgi:hypothetical protein